MSKLLENVGTDYNILCEDFNIALNKEIDIFNYRHTNNPKVKKTKRPVSNVSLTVVARW